MRVLLLHNRYIQLGGEDSVYEAELDLLIQRGEKADTLLFWNEHLLDRSGIINQARTIANTLWSRSAAERVKSVATQNRYDIVHVHNTFPTGSPSVYSAARSTGAAVVQTLHNYRLLCPNALFFRDGHICEDCLGKFVPWPGVSHACYRNSRAQTGVTAAMLTVHRARRTLDREIDLFIALTEFSRQKFIEGGLPADRIVVKPNFLSKDPGAVTGGQGFLFVGRLDEAKGIRPMVEAWRHLPGSALRIVGDGPLAGEAREAASSNLAITYAGRMNREQVLQQMQRHLALIFPSICYETFGMTIIEAFATGLPVIASRLGSMAEIIADGRTGLLFEPGNAQDLAAKVSWAAAHPDEMHQMGANARLEYETKYTAEIGYKNLIACYEQALEIRRSRDK